MTLSDCSATAAGGAIFAVGATLQLRGVSVLRCFSSDFGGGIFSKNSQLEVQDSAVSDCNARVGGGIAVAGQVAGSLGVTLARTEITRCHATERGGEWLAVQSSPRTLPRHYP